MSRKVADITKCLGDPEQVASNLKTYRESAKVLSSARADLIGKYPKRWVAIHRGIVVADASSLESLLLLTDEKGVPRDQMVVRFIDRNVRKLIL